MPNERDKLPADQQLRLYKLELENAEAAVASLPQIEAAQKARVEQAQERLNIEESELKRIQESEKDEAAQRVKELKAKVTQLTKRTR